MTRRWLFNIGGGLLCFGCSMAGYAAVGIGGELIAAGSFIVGLLFCLALAHWTLR